MGAFGEFHRAGEGPPLFLIHGFTATWPIWGPVLPLLEEQFEVVAPTFPGHTGGPPVSSGSTPVTQIADGLERMLDELGWEAPHLCGFSLGGMLVLELAKRGRAADVTAISPAGSYGSSTIEKAYRKTFRLFMRTYRSAALAPAIGPLFERAGFRQLMMRDQMVGGARLGAAEMREMTKSFRATPVFRDVLDADSEPDRELRGLEQVTCPVTIAWGDTDRVLPPDTHLPFFREHLPNATFVNIKRAGHVPFWDAPERVADIVTQTALHTERSQTT